MSTYKRSWRRTLLPTWQVRLVRHGLLRLRLWSADQRLGPGVHGTMHESVRTSHVTGVFADQPGSGDVSRWLDSLPTDRRFVFEDVISPILRGMLERRGFQPRGWRPQVVRPRYWVRDAGVVVRRSSCARDLTTDELAYYRGQPVDRASGATEPAPVALRPQAQQGTSQRATVGNQAPEVGL